MVEVSYLLSGILKWKIGDTIKKVFAYFKSE